MPQMDIKRVDCGQNQTARAWMMLLLSARLKNCLRSAARELAATQLKLWMHPQPLSQS